MVPPAAFNDPLRPSPPSSPPPPPLPPSLHPSPDHIVVAVAFAAVAYVCITDGSHAITQQQYTIRLGEDRPPSLDCEFACGRKVSTMLAQSDGEIFSPLHSQS